MEANLLVDTPTHHNGCSSEPAYETIASAIRPKDTVPKSDHAYAVLEENMVESRLSSTDNVENDYYASLDTGSCDSSTEPLQAGHQYAVLEGPSH